ncbi:MAG: tetratricopeptide repeat protein [Candidatus Zapsychrus exili]|nr:tetratricopeptide repeat protein [Candidatus Zapsychrus exili]
MNNKFWQKTNYFFGLLPLGALFGLLVYVAGVEIKDLDIWLHLAMGKFITINHFVPDFDVLSFSIAGKSWINHEWLFQVIVYNIFNTWGPDGVIKMQIAVVTMTMFMLLLVGYNKNRQFITTFFLLIVFLVYQHRFTTRPDLFSLLFFTIYIFILSLHIDKKWSLPVLFIVQVLWSNIHGFFFFGPLFIFVGIFSEFIKRHVKLPAEWNESGRLTNVEYGRLKILFIITIFACFFNPCVVAGALYPVKVFFSLSGENKIFFDFIQELQKPITRATLFDMNRFGYYKLTIILSFFSFVINRRKIDISALLLWIIFLVFSLGAVRNISFFAFAAYLVFVTNSTNVSFNDIFPIKFSHKKFQYVTLIALNIALLAWIMQYSENVSRNSYYDFDKYQRKSEFGGISRLGLPHKAADFLVDNNIRGNFFNDFNSGAYLLGRTYPDIKVFIDGRTEVHGAKFFKMYRNIWKNGPKELTDSVIKKYNITGAFLNSIRQRIPKPIVNYFYNNKDWVIVYFDYDAVIFLKNVKENREIIKKFRIKLSRYKPPEIDLFKIGVEQVKPSHQYYRAFTLESLGLYDAAMAEIKEALKMAPNYPELYRIMGKIYSKKKDYDRAFESFRIAASLSGGKKKDRHNLALAYLEMKEYEYAIKEYRKIIEMWPKDPKAYFFLAKAYAENDKLDEVIVVLKRVHIVAPEAFVDIIDIGDIVYDQEAYLKAQEIYKILLSSKKKLDIVYYKLGDVSDAAGDVAEAKANYKKSLEINPRNKEVQKKLDKLD